MGQGSALIVVPFGSQRVSERVALDIFAAPSDDGYVHLAILAAGERPIQALIVLTAIVLPGRLRIALPPVPTLPGAPYAALVEMNATLGGPLTYYERVHGRIVAYRPRGIGLPDSCPRGGWGFDARLSFADGQLSRARTTVPCPGGARSHGQARR